MTVAEKPNGKVSSSYNSYRHSSKKERVAEVVERSEIELTPLQIAQKTGINHSTVRVYLPQLVAENRIITPYHGAYCAKTIHGVGAFGALRVHNIVVTGDAEIDEFDEVVETVGDVKVRVLFGSKRNKVSIFISCDAGMDRNGCLLALDKAFGIVRSRIGKDLEHVCLKTFELNRDFLGVRVDRPTCITRVGLYDMVERVYQKAEGVRHEWKISKEMPIAEFEALLRGGVTSYNIMQANFALVQEVKKLGEALKMTNNQLLQQSKVLEGILHWIYKNNDEEKPNKQ